MTDSPGDTYSRGVTESDITVSNPRLPDLIPTEMFPDGVGHADMRQLRDDFARFMMEYKFGIDTVHTKIAILRDELTHLHDYNPIENLSSRLKSPDSILDKIGRKKCPPTFDGIRAAITDIAGVRVTTSFVSDVYRVLDMLTRQDDVTVIEIRDYIARPKPNGYRSLHALLAIPVNMSDRVVTVTVELQIRTIAMDFWASLEHKIYYKYDTVVPAGLLDELAEAAETAHRLDATMEHLHEEIRGSDTRSPDGDVVPTDDVLHRWVAARSRFDNTP